MSTNNRGKLLIDNQVQLTLIRRIMLHWVAFMALFLTIVFAIDFFIREPGVTITESLSLTVQKNGLVLILMVAMMPSFLLDTVKLSHRFAGPISRLKSGLSDLAEGREVQQINLRKNDFWGELASDFNRVAVRLNLASSQDDQSQVSEGNPTTGTK